MRRYIKNRRHQVDRFSDDEIALMSYLKSADCVSDARAGELADMLRRRPYWVVERNGCYALTRMALRGLCQHAQPLPRVKGSREQDPNKCDPVTSMELTEYEKEYDRKEYRGYTAVFYGCLANIPRGQDYGTTGSIMDGRIYNPNGDLIRVYLEEPRPTLWAPRTAKMIHNQLTDTVYHDSIGRCDRVNIWPASYRFVPTQTALAEMIQ